MTFLRCPLLLGRITIGLRVSWPSRPDVAASYAVPVRRAGSLPTASFRFRLATDTLAVQLTVPAIRVRRGLSPPSHPEAPPSGIAPVKALRAMPGAPQKRGLRFLAGPFSHKFWRARQELNLRPSASEAGFSRIRILPPHRQKIINFLKNNYLKQNQCFLTLHYHTN